MDDISKNEYNNNTKSLTLEKRIKKKNKIDNKNFIEFLDNSENNQRIQYSYPVTKKHILHNKDLQKKEQIIFLEKIKFIQLWWKTIFQIIKMQKHIRGFIYRQRLIEELDKEEIAVDNLLFLIKSYKKIVYKYLFANHSINN